jgi:hypothetical protein
VFSTPAARILCNAPRPYNGHRSRAATSAVEALH